MKRVDLDLEATARAICAMDQATVAAFICELRQHRQLTKLVHQLNEAIRSNRPAARDAMTHLGFI